MNILKASAHLISQSFAAVRGVVPAALLPVVFLAPLAESATDTPPNRMTVQSYITDDTGTPLGSTTAVNKKMVFILYTADTGGEVVFADEQIVTVDNGHFSVVLGEGSPVGDESHDLADAFSGPDASDRFIEIQVSDTDGSSPQTLSPRLRLLPSAYSFLAAYANEAAQVTGGGVSTAAIADSAVNSAKITDESLTAADLGPNSVGTSEVINNSLTALDLAENSVGNSELAANLLFSGHIGVNTWWPNVAMGLKAVNSTDYLIYGVDSAGQNDFYVNSAGVVWARGGLGANMVNSSAVLDNSLTASDLAANSVGASELAANAVGNSELAGDLTLTGRNGVNIRWSDTTFGIKMNSGDSYPLFIEQAGGTNIFWVNGVGQAFHSGGALVLSDRRYKNSIAPVTGLLDGALALEAVTYKLNAMPDQPAQIGLVAQDVQEVFPSIVVDINDEEGHLAVAYDRVGVIAIGAVQELNAKVEVLEAENAVLHERLTALETLVQTLGNAALPTP